MSESKTPTPTPEPVTGEDEQRIRELLDTHPALLQPEAIELRRHLLDARDDLAAARAQLAAFVPPGALSAGEIPALCGTCMELLCVPGLPGCARCVKADAERLRVEQATVFAALRDALGTSPATLGQAAVQAVNAIADRDAARAEVKRLRAALGIEVRRNAGARTVPSGAPDSVVRSWARERDIRVSPKGRVAPDVRALYEAAWRTEQDGGDPC